MSRYNNFIICHDDIIFSKYHHFYFNSKQKIILFYIIILRKYINQLLTRPRPRHLRRRRQLDLEQSASHQSTLELQNEML